MTLHMNMMKFLVKIYKFKIQDFRILSIQQAYNMHLMYVQKENINIIVKSCSKK
jgi:hypothetical protein